MDIDYKKLGKRIKEAREKKKLTQEQLAEILGISNNYISNIERSRSIPSLETIVGMCNALDVTPDFVLLDSIFTSREYIKDEIALKLKKCSERDIRLVSRFLDLLLEERDT